VNLEGGKESRGRAKRGSPRAAVGLALVVSMGVVSSCGYRAVYGGEPPERLHVELVRTLVPDTVAAEEVVSGLREGLARAGALAPGEGWPRVEVEVLRADETSEGVGVASAGGAGAAGGGPRARGTNVGLLGRAWIARSPGMTPERDTGDVSDGEVVAVDESAGALDAKSSVFRHADALRAAGRRLGERLADRLLGP
jgi:hypothetical protein